MIPIHDDEVRGLRWRAPADTAHAFLDDQLLSLCGRVQRTDRLPDAKSAACRSCVRHLANQRIDELDLESEITDTPILWQPSRSTSIAHAFLGDEGKSVCRLVRRRSDPIPHGQSGFCSECWAKVYPDRPVPSDPPVTPTTPAPRRRRPKKADRFCSVEGCQGEGRRLGLCEAHARRKDRHGSPTARRCRCCREVRVKSECPKASVVSHEPYVCSLCVEAGCELTKLMSPKRPACRIGEELDL